MVHLTRNRNSGGNRRVVVQVHAAPLTDGDITAIDGVPVTSLARTVLDLCRTLPIEQAVAAGDRALVLGLVRAVLEELLAQMTRWPGTRQVRRAVALFDPRSESAGESVSRVGLHEDGLPMPDPQQDIFDEDGQFVARVDFCWRKQRTIGEFDGKRSSIDGCSSPDSQLRTCSLRRSDAKTRSVILVGRLSDG